MRDKSKSSRFPISVFWVYFGVLSLMSGLHYGLIVLMETLKLHATVQCILPLLYWSLVAMLLVYYTRSQMHKTYEAPIRRLADAADAVANGDFSVYVSPIHTSDKSDYMDEMIADFNKMVEELGSIETLKTDFFSNVSHEFKTPLSVIHSNAQLLENTKLSSDEQRQYVDNIIKATRRLSSLIGNMLKLNKLEKQVIAPKPEEYDLSAQLAECALQFEDIWEKKNINFEADIEEKAIVSADKELMELVWTNLLSNAMKFTDDNGTVILRQVSDDDTVTVSIIDTGCGMSDDTKKHIFDKFYQGDSSHSTEGNGLGLSLVMRILQLSDCKIDVKSELNQGSEFIVTIRR